MSVDDAGTRTAPVVFTLGHSNRSLNEFRDLLVAWRVETLIDVRRHPVSSRYPHFSRRELLTSLRTVVRYEWAQQLGGMRTPIPESENDALTDDAFRGYADHMAGREFQSGLQLVLESAIAHCTALMCAEADWRECHRSLLSDALVAAGASVVHIRSVMESEPHVLTCGARIVDGRLSYTRPRQATLFE